MSLERLAAPGFVGARPLAYTCLVLLAVIVTLVVSVRADGAFACQATGYGRDRYLAYCQGRSYAEYDHGAFWFRLEPRAWEAARRAEVLFLGNSRMQLGLSTPEVARWFDSTRVTRYLLGFSYNSNHLFAGPLLDRLHPRAKAYVIDLDQFFVGYETPPAAAILHDSMSLQGYRQKRGWQLVHRRACSAMPFLCRDEHTFFRDRETGAWVTTGGKVRPKPVSYRSEVVDTAVEAEARRGRAFLARLPVPPECIVLTMVPTAGTEQGHAEAVARALGLPLLAPEVSTLQTFDESHLDRPSAERWSSAFMALAGPRLQRCLMMADGLPWPPVAP